MFHQRFGTAFSPPPIPSQRSQTCVARPTTWERGSRFVRFFEERVHMPDWKEKLALTAQRNRQEIVRAKLDRREMMRLGLLTAGGALVAKAGLSSRAGFAASGPGGGGDTTSTNSLTSADDTLSSAPPAPPINRPWTTPMPRLTIKKPVDASLMTATVLDP